MMSKEMLGQALKYQKNASDNVFLFMNVFQNSQKDILQKTLEQMSWLPSTGRDGYMSFASNCLKATENMKSMVDKSFVEMEKYLDTQLGETFAKEVVKKTSTPVKKAAKPAAKKTTPARKKTPVKTTAATKKAATTKTTAATKKATTTKTAATKATATKTAAASPAKQTAKKATTAKTDTSATS